MTKQYAVFIIVLIAMFFGAKAMAQPGCLLSFDGVVGQYKNDGKVIPDSYNEKVVKDCMPVFQSICNDPKSRTQIIVPAPNQYVNPSSPKIDSTDVDRFCKSINKK